MVESRWNWMEVRGATCKWKLSCYGSLKLQCGSPWGIKDSDVLWYASLLRTLSSCNALELLWQELTSEDFQESWGPDFSPQLLQDTLYVTLKKHVEHKDGQDWSATLICFKGSTYRLGACTGDVDVQTAVAAPAGKGCAIPWVLVTCDMSWCCRMCCAACMQKAGVFGVSPHLDQLSPTSFSNTAPCWLFVAPKNLARIGSKSNERNSVTLVEVCSCLISTAMSQDGGPTTSSNFCTPHTGPHHSPSFEQDLMLKIRPYRSPVGQNARI